MKAFFKGVGTILGLSIVVMTALTLFPKASMPVATAVLVVPLIALLRPLPSIGLGHRGLNTAIALIVGAPTALFVIGMNAQAGKLAELKQSNPAAYLAELKMTDRTKYLSELSAIDPERYKSELAMVAEKEAQRVAAIKAAEVAERDKQEAAMSARRAQEDERRAKAAKSARDQYLQRLDQDLASLQGMKASEYTSSVEDINAAIVIIGAWTLLYEKGAEMDLGPEERKKRQRFKKLLIRKQAGMLPVLRDAYGPAMRKKLWLADGSARTIGTGYRTVEFISGTFVLNANIQQFHTEIRESLLMLRFTRAQYKWFDQASEYTYYTLEPPKDAEMVKWESGGRFHRLE